MFLFVIDVNARFRPNKCAKGAHPTCFPAKNRIRGSDTPFICVCVCVARARPNSANPPQNNASVGRTRTTRRHPLHLCVCVCSRSEFLCLRVCILRPRGPNYLSRGRRAQGPRDPFPDHPHALVSTEAWRQGARSSNPAHPPKGYV